MMSETLKGLVNAKRIEDWGETRPRYTDEMSWNEESSPEAYSVRPALGQETHANA